MRLRFIPVPAALTLIAASCGPAGSEQPIVVAGVGLATPESVLHDVEADVYLVSNINGGPLVEDDNGFISRIAPDGRVLALKWIDGASDRVTLHAPKGMAIVGDVLYVTDIHTVRKFDRTSGEPLGDIHLAGSTFLNDLATAPDGSLYLTDSGLRASADGTGFEPSGTDAVYRLGQDDSIQTVLAGAALGGPNGVIVAANAVWVVSFGSGELYRLVTGERTDVIKLPGGQLDGIEALDGELLISSWEAKAVFRGPPAGPFTAVVADVEAPADIGLDRRRQRVLIPLFMANELRIVPLSMARTRSDTARLAETRD
jgi:hypothetical protein